MARTTATISHFNRSRSLLGITSSIKNLVAPGSTKLANLLIMIKIRPIKSCFRLGQMMVANTCLVVTLRSFLGVMKSVMKYGDELIKKPVTEEQAFQILNLFL